MNTDRVEEANGVSYNSEIPIYLPSLTVDAGRRFLCAWERHFFLSFFRGRMLRTFQSQLKILQVDRHAWRKVHTSRKSLGQCAGRTSTAIREDHSSNIIQRHEWPHRRREKVFSLASFQKIDAMNKYDRIEWKSAFFSASSSFDSGLFFFFFVFLRLCVRHIQRVGQFSGPPFGCFCICHQRNAHNKCRHHHHRLNKCAVLPHTTTNRCNDSVETIASELSKNESTSGPVSVHVTYENENSSVIFRSLIVVCIPPLRLFLPAVVFIENIVYLKKNDDCWCCGIHACTITDTIEMEKRWKRRETAIGFVCIMQNQMEICVAKLNDTTITTVLTSARDDKLNEKRKTEKQYVSFFFSFDFIWQSHFVLIWLLHGFTHETKRTSTACSVNVSYNICLTQWMSEQTFDLWW